MNTSIAVDIQRTSVNEARSSGEVFSIITDVFNENEGIIERKTMISEVGSRLGLSIIEASAVHTTGTGLPKNYLISGVDWCINDMKEGKYGTDIDIITDNSGLWLLDGIIDKEYSQEYFDAKLYKDENVYTKEKEPVIDYRKELSDAFKLLNASEKAKFKKAGGKMEKGISIMMNDKVSASEAIFKISS